MSAFKRAKKSQSRLRMAIIGPPSAGKTYTALAIATQLAASMASIVGMVGMGGGGKNRPGRIALIDTEHGSAAKYADEFTFDSLELGQFDPRNYIESIQAAEAEGYDVLVVDSLSHAWMGKGGALELVDKAAARSQSKNTFTAWKDITPLHNALIDAIVSCRCHIIVTMRSKTEYVLQPNARGGMEPVKVGMGPVQRDGMEYEFDVIGEMDQSHRLIVTKTRCRAIDGEVFDRPGKVLADRLADWLSDGEPVPVPTSAVAATGTPINYVAEPVLPHVAGMENLPDTPKFDLSHLITFDQQFELQRLIAATEMTDVQVRMALAKRGTASMASLSSQDAEEMIARLTQILAAKQAAVAETVADTNQPPTPTATDPTVTPLQVGGDERDESGESDNYEVPDATRPDAPEKKPRRRANSKAEAAVPSS